MKVEAKGRHAGIRRRRGLDPSEVRIASGKRREKATPDIFRRTFLWMSIGGNG